MISDCVEKMCFIYFWKRLFHNEIQSRREVSQRFYSCHSEGTEYTGHFMNTILR